MVLLNSLLMYHKSFTVNYVITSTYLCHLSDHAIKELQRDETKQMLESKPGLLLGADAFVMIPKGGVCFLATLQCLSSWQRVISNVI